MRPFGTTAVAMRDLKILAIFALAIAGSSDPRPQAAEGTSRAQKGTIPQQDRFFLHLLAPRAYTDPPVPPHRIVTARVYLQQDFAVSAGDTGNPFTNGWDGAWTNPIWTKTGSPQARPLDPVFNSGDAVLAGRIERVGGKFSANLQGRDRTALCYYHGEIELEKPVYEQGGLYCSNAISAVWFVLSASPDCSQFLKQLEDGTLRRPNIVEQNSSAAKAWEGTPASNGVLTIQGTEPSAVPNPAPPHR